MNRQIPIMTKATADSPVRNMQTMRTTRTLTSVQSGPGRKSHGGTMIGLFVGLVVGVLIAFGVVWYLNKMPLPFQDKGIRAEKTDAKSASGGQQTPQPLPGKPGDKVDDKPRFDFYKILPSGQEPAPAGSDAKQSQPQPATQLPASPAATTQPETYYLQAGAFQKSTDADNLKAKLALMGLETSLQEVSVPDKGTMHRVRVGPFAKFEDMNRVRNQLSQNGIQATVVKIKDPAQ